MGTNKLKYMKKKNTSKEHDNNQICLRRLAAEVSQLGQFCQIPLP